MQLSSRSLSNHCSAFNIQRVKEIDEIFSSINYVHISQQALIACECTQLWTEGNVVHFIPSFTPYGARESQITRCHDYSISDIVWFFYAFVHLPHQYCRSGARLSFSGSTSGLACALGWPGVVLITEQWLLSRLSLLTIK